MKTNLAEYYGQRFTSKSGIVLFIVIILIGISMALCEGSSDSKVKGGVEQNILNH